MKNFKIQNFSLLIAFTLRFSENNSTLSDQQSKVFFNFLLLFTGWLKIAKILPVLPINRFLDKNGRIFQKVEMRN